jgi:hypothetical protein
MKIGQEVNVYFPGTGERLVTEVIEIEGVGESKAKVLTLRYTEEGEQHEIEDVHHHTDAEPGDVFWMLRGVERAPAGWNEQ